MTRRIMCRADSMANCTRRFGNNGSRLITMGADGPRGCDIQAGNDAKSIRSLKETDLRDGRAALQASRLGLREFQAIALFCSPAAPQGHRTKIGTQRTCRRIQCTSVIGG